MYVYNIIYIYTYMLDDFKKNCNFKKGNRD